MPKDKNRNVCEAIDGASLKDKRSLAYGIGAFVGATTFSFAGDAAGLVGGLGEISGGVLYDAGAVVVAAASSVWVIRKILSLI